MKPSILSRRLAVAVLLALCAAPAPAANLVAGIYVPPAGCTPEGLDTLRSLGLNTLLVSNPNYDPNEVLTAAGLAGEVTFSLGALRPGLYQVRLYVRQETAPALTLAIAGRRIKQAGALRVGPQVWQVDFGPQKVPHPGEPWTVSGGRNARLLYVACGALFPQQWSVAGPYDDPELDLGAAFPPDDPGFHAWRAVPADRTGLLDFARLWGKKSNALTYAALDAWSPKEQQAWLLVGSDDKVRVLLNGQVVHENPTLRHASPDEDVVPVRLCAGWNRILAKVVNVGDDWGLYLRLYEGDRPLRCRRAR